MPFDVQGARKAGYTDAEIAAHLGSKYGFDTDGAIAVGYSPAQVIAHLANKKKPKKKPEEEDQGFLRSVADSPVIMAESAAGSLASILEVFGADNPVSKTLDDTAQWFNSFRSAQSKKDAAEQQRLLKAAEDKGIWENVKAAGNAIGVAPLDTLAMVVGSAAPYVASILGGAVVAGGVAVAGGTGVVKGSIYDATEEALIQNGVSPEEAAKAADEAQSYTGENLDMIALGGVIGGIANRVGLEPALAKSIGIQAVKNAVAKGAIKQGAKEFAKEGVTEAAQAGQEQLAQNLAQQRVGVDTPLWRGVAGQAAFEGLAGGILGGSVGANNARVEANKAKAKTKTGKRSAAQEAIDAEVEAISDPEIADIVRKYRKVADIPIADAIQLATAEVTTKRKNAARPAAADLATVGDTLPDAGSAAAAPDPAGSLNGFRRTGQPDTVGGAEPTTAPSNVTDGGVATPSALVSGSEAGTGAANDTLVAPTLTAETQAVDAAEATTNVNLTPDKKERVVAGLATKPELATDPATVEEVVRVADALPLINPLLDETPADVAQTTLATEPLATRESVALPDVLPTATTEAQVDLTEPVLDLTPRVANASTLRTVAERRAAFVPIVAQVAQEAGVELDAPTTTTLVQQLATKKGSNLDPREALGKLVNITAPMPDITPVAVEDAPIAEAPAPVEAPAPIAPAVEAAPITPPVTTPEIAPALEAAANPENAPVPEADVVAPALNINEEAPTPVAIDNAPLDSNPEFVDAAPVEEEVAPAPLDPNLEELSFQDKKRLALDTLNNNPDIKVPVQFAYDEKNKKFPWKINQQNALGTSNTRIMQDSSFSGLMQQIAGVETDTSGRIKKARKADRQAKATGVKPDFLRPEEVETGADADPVLTDFQRAAQDFTTRTEAQYGPSWGISPMRKSVILADIAKASQVEANRTKNRPKYKHDIGKNLLPITSKYQWFKDLADKKIGAGPMDEELKTPLSRASLNKPSDEEMSSEVKRLVRVAVEQGSRLRTRAGGKPATPMSVADIKAELLPVMRNWDNSPKLEVVEDYMSLPAEVQDILDGMNATDTTQGMMHKNTLYIVADNIASKEEAKAVLYHEALGHLGLELRFQQKLGEVLSDIYLTNKKVRDAADKWLIDNPDTYNGAEDATVLATEEVLAGRQEYGPTDVGAMARLAAVVRQFGRMLSKAFKRIVPYTDADVRAILASSAKEVTGGYKGVIAPNSPEGIAMRKAAAANSAALTKVRESDLSTNGGATSALKAIGDAIKNGHDYKNWKPGIEKYGSRLSSENLQKLMMALPTDGIVGWYSDTYKKVSGMREDTDPTPLERLNRLIPQMTSMRGTMARAAGKMADKLRAFVSEQGNVALADTMHLARGNRVDPETFGDKALDQVYADDAPLQQKIKNGSGVNLTTQQKAGHASSVTARKNQIKEVYDAWKTLGQQDGGHEMFAEVREYYSTMNRLERAMRDKYIQDMDIDEDSKQKLLDTIRKEQETVSDDDVDDSLYPNVYFPYMRHGKFWLSISNPDMKGGRQFFMFDSSKDRNKYRKEHAKQVGRSAEDGDYFRQGEDTAAIKKNFEENSSMLQAQFAIIDKMTATDNLKYDAKTYGGKQEAVDALKQDLKDELYQTYLRTRPEASLRKRYIHANNVTGFTSDVLRNFVVSANQYSSQLAKLRYSKPIEVAIEEANAALEGMPPSIQSKLGVMTDAVAARARKVVMPPERSAVTSALSEISFVWFLTAPATAIIQLTAIPMRVLPRLTTEYGEVKGWKTLAKFSGAFSITGGEQLFSLEDSQLLRDNPILAKAFNTLRDHRETFGTLITEALRNEEAPLSETKNMKSRAIKVVGAAISATERMSREVAGMATFELEYARLGKTKPDLTPEERFELAIDAAADTVNATVGNYSEFNKPTVFTGDIGRMVFQFKTFSAITYKFFIGAVQQMVKPLNKGDRAAAVREMTGVLAMGSLFFGVTGLPLFTMVMWLIDMAREMNDDDDDDEEMRRQSPYGSHSAEYQFRYEWLPEMLGQKVTEGAESTRLVDMLLNGPLSEMSDVNIGSRTSYNDMWFRDNSRAGDSAFDWFVHNTVGNIPVLSLASNMSRGVDYFDKGEYERGVESVVPSFARNTMAGIRYATEGSKTSAGDTIMSAEELSDANIAAQILGFQPTRLAQIQEERADRNKLEAKAEGKRTALLRRLNMVRTSYPVDREKVIDVVKEMAEFNKQWPAPDMIITEETIDKSFKGFTDRKELQYRGSIFTKKDAYRGVPGAMQAGD